MTDEPDTRSFKDLGVGPDLCLICEKVGWKTPTPIQRETLPWALQGRDLIALAETGSGKTGAFALPILQKLLDTPQKWFAVIIAPTRELCLQISQNFESLGNDIALSTCLLVGGTDIASQSLALSRKPHVIVATPGRLVDHLENTKGFHISAIKFLVMDEADRLLSMDFEAALNKIVQCAPKERQTFLFSATMTNKVSKLQRACLRNPMKCEINTKYDTAANLVQNYKLVPFKHKQTWLAAILNHMKTSSGIIFVDTCLNAQKLATVLRKLHFDSVCLHGQMSQTQRFGALNQFKSGNRKLLVATDVASRGLDIPQVDVVINFDIPKATKDYIHRVGRTARAGRSGRSITLVTQYDLEGYSKIEHLIDRKLDEYTEVAEETAMALHESVLEALRSAHLEMKSTEDDAKQSLTGSKRKLLLTKHRSKLFLTKSISKRMPN